MHRKMDFVLCALTVNSECSLAYLMEPCFRYLLKRLPSSVSKAVFMSLLFANPVFVYSSCSFRSW